ncbi:hypothetical protein MHYP_G00155730 [Metynnis hypsauchen]
MDDSRDASMDTTPACDGECKQTAHPDIERLRAEIDLQAKVIDSLSKTVAVLEAERSQTVSALLHLQAELHNMARQQKGQNLEKRFEALRFEVTTELHYLQSLLLPWPGLSPCCPSASCSSLHPIELRNQAAVNHISQELYHSQRILWEQIEELRKAVHRIQLQLKLHREDILKRQTESHHKDMSIERMIDTCQSQDVSIQKLLRQNDAVRVRSNVSEIQTKLQNLVISKGKAPKKTGCGMKTIPRPLLPSSDSDESLNIQHLTAKAKAPVDITSRRK